MLDSSADDLVKQAQFYLAKGLKDQASQIIAVLAKYNNPVIARIKGLLENLNTAEGTKNIRVIIDLRKALQAEVASLSHERIFDQYHPISADSEERVELAKLCLDHAFKRLFQKRATEPIREIIQNQDAQDQVRIMSESYRSSITSNLQALNVDTNWLAFPKPASAPPVNLGNIRERGKQRKPAIQQKQSNQQWFKSQFSFSEEKVIGATKKFLPAADITNSAMESVRFHYFWKGRYKFQDKVCQSFTRIVPLLSHAPLVRNSPFIGMLVRLLGRVLTINDVEERGLNIDEKALYAAMVLAFWKYKAASLLVLMMYEGGYTFYNAYRLFWYNMPLQSLCNAVIDGDASQVKQMLNEGSVNVNDYCLTGDTPLLNAIYYDNSDFVDLLLAAGADYNQYSDIDRGILPIVQVFLGQFQTSNSGIILTNHKVNMKILRSLLKEKKLDILGPSQNKGHNVLLIALSMQEEEAALLLIQHVDLDLMNQQHLKTGFTPLYFAIQLGQKKAALALIEKGVELNKVINTQTYLDLAIEKKMEDIAIAIVERFTAPDAVQIGRRSFDFKISGNKRYLEKAFSSSFEKLALALIKRGIGLNDKVQEFTTLEFAIGQGLSEAALAILKHPKTQFKNGVCLVVAIEKGMSEVALALIARDVDLKERGHLIHAVNKRLPKVALKLITRGEDVNQAVKGITSLYLAIINLMPEVALKLIEKGVDVNKGYKGETPLYAAIGVKMSEVALKLIDKGADVNHNSEMGTLLHIAIRLKLVQVSLKLIEKGASLTILRTSSQSPGQGMTVLQDALSNNVTDAAIAILNKLGRGNIKSYALEDALAFGNEAVAMSLMDLGVTVEDGNIKALGYAIENNMINIAVRPIDEGIEIHEDVVVPRSHIFLEKPMALAISQNNAQITKALHNKGAVLDARAITRLADTTNEIQDLFCMDHEQDSVIDEDKAETTEEKAAPAGENGSSSGGWLDWFA